MLPARGVDHVRVSVDAPSLLAFDHGRYVRVADGATMRKGACYLLAGMPPSCRISPATSRMTQ